MEGKGVGALGARLRVRDLICGEDRLAGGGGGALVEPRADLSLASRGQSGLGAPGRLCPVLQA